MRVLVVGGTKFIGPHVVGELARAGHEVVVFHRGETESPLATGVRHVHSPLAARPVVEFPAELAEIEPDVVLHMIAMGERDARAAMDFFEGRAGRVVAASSGDVYLAYGRAAGVEPGPVVATPLSEEAELRTVLYPYRRYATSEGDLEYDYEKILVEREVLGRAALPGTVLRLPKVYGPGPGGDLGHVYRMRAHPNWRWTHGYVEDVAHAIAIAVAEDRAAGRVYNVGEATTPTIAERLGDLPPPADEPGDAPPGFDFSQDVVYDTARIREELGFAEVVDYAEGLRRTVDGKER